MITCDVGWGGCEELQCESGWLEPLTWSVRVGEAIPGKDGKARFGVSIPVRLSFSVQSFAKRRMP